MNELRMYVEHLFEGKVLTPETIELKEEIYGNLMARYEDYVAQGLSEADALARTKASITDVDDMMAGEGSAASAVEDALSSAPTTVIPPAAETVKMPTPDTAAQAAVRLSLRRRAHQLPRGSPSGSRPSLLSRRSSSACSPSGTA